MKFWRKLINPLFALIAIQLAWLLVVVVWIRWFVSSHQRLRELAEKYSPELLHGTIDWVLLAEGLLLLALILGGVYVIFIYWRRQASLYREQKKFIAQVTHELKSPLASLQLHLETIRLRKPQPEKLDAFVATMLADTERLHGLINNLLTANRLELKAPRLSLRKADFSAFVTNYFAQQQPSLPAHTRFELDVETGLVSRFEGESLEIVLRNLLENALFYSHPPADIQVSLRGEKNHCHLTIRDQGRGLPPEELKKVFRIFYRANRGSERIPGTGLGLFIARAIIRRHRGKIWLESAGPGKGTSVHILLPRLTEPA
ncbi:sensor histidine kinase [Geoalkalibacter halelectricus]|uniref:histidine kinase n=1 Tax=Geoalkalibacter halelectricus TaxID=2847045 RepID=A0ABY5ZNZ6_9BACT|nr:HAMP domain-containing sensor histidine kinase [Geoalkalibacter halelectricus]MDO3377368.1 HAMP domain-containing histidine kinase [Geoalkalibacter halelectricus]UWZ80867.1 HAMP domain-containing histidine kinase [Geoalkalibacter halelectricus]